MFLNKQAGRWRIAQSHLFSVHHIIHITLGLGSAPSFSTMAIASPLLGLVCWQSSISFPGLVREATRSHLVPLRPTLRLHRSPFPRKCKQGTLTGSDGHPHRLRNLRFRCFLVKFVLSIPNAYGTWHVIVSVALPSSFRWCSMPPGPN